MKEKIFYYDVQDDVTDVECDLCDATVKVSVSEDGKFCVKLSKTENISIGNSESALYISQKRKRGRQQIEICVPQYVVPSIRLSGKRCGLEVNGGLYGEIKLAAESGKASVCDCAFESLEIIGGDLQATVSRATARTGLFIQLDKGDAIAENVFAPRAECRTKKGNLGFVNLNCKESMFETGKGNITATVTGDKDSFSTTLLAKVGTVSSSGEPREGAERTVQAYAEKGNIMLDFAQEEKGAEINFDDKADNADEAAAADAEDLKETV